MRKILLYILFLILATACQSEKKVTPTKIAAAQEFANPNDAECLAPITTFSYQLGDGATMPDWHDTLPSGNWEAVAKLPDFPTPVPPIEFAEYGRSTANLEALQTLNGKDKIWVYFETPEDYHFTYYQIDTGRWGSAKYAAKQENYFFFPRLFLDPNNTLWAVGNPSNAKGIDADTALLSVYDEATQQFKGVLALKDIPTFDSSRRITNVTITDLQADSRGNLWFLVSAYDEKGWEHQLFKFSPISYTLERHLAEFKLDYREGISLVVSSEDVLYLLGAQNDTIIRYNLAKEEIEKIGIPSGLASNGSGDLSSVTTLFLDSQQRLWINDKGWLDIFHRDWNVIIQSPTFIVVQAGNGLWTRSQPTYSLETKDGRLWYSAYRGTGWVNPSTGQWCLFTTHPSNVVKDSSGHLWIAAAGKLYQSLFKP